MKLLVVATVSLVFGTLAFAAPPPNADPNSETSKWFERQHNLNDAGCCGQGDGHVLKDNQWRISDQGYEVLIDSKWHRIARWHRLRDAETDPNPTGNAVVWYSYVRDEPDGIKIWCFAPGWES